MQRLGEKRLGSRDRRRQMNPSDLAPALLDGGSLPEVPFNK